MRIWQPSGDPTRVQASALERGAAAGVGAGCHRRSASFSTQRCRRIEGGEGQPSGAPADLESKTHQEAATGISRLGTDEADVRIEMGTDGVHPRKANVTEDWQRHRTGVRGGVAAP